MALPVAPFQKLEVVIERLLSLGFEIRTLNSYVKTPYGEMKNIKFAVDPEDTQKFFVLDYEPGEYLAPLTIEGLERRLGTDLGFPKEAAFDTGLLS